jgi:5-formyltetrahydrofolate cyclo-ligase
MSGMRTEGRTTQEAKREWRRRMAEARGSLAPAERIRRSAAICRTVAERALVPLGAERGRPLSVGVYGAFRSEADPSGCADWCLANGHLVCAPRIDGDRLELRRIEAADDWIAGRWGVPEPDPVRTLPLPDGEAPDVILVPGLAFDRLGRRIGYGGGYYDRWYADCARIHSGPGSARPLWIGFAFQLQVANEPLPVEPHDLKLDGLATEDGILWWNGR